MHPYRTHTCNELRAESAAPHDIAFTLSVSDYGERHAELRLVSIA